MADNTPSDKYHYQLTVHTGTKKGAGTTSNVFLVVGGDSSQTDVRQLKDTTEKVYCIYPINNGDVHISHQYNTPFQAHFLVGRINV